MQEAKMLIKLIVVNANHFIRYKCKITHCIDSQTLSNYISTVALDDNQKPSSMKCSRFYLVLELLPVQVVLIEKASNLLQWAS